MSQQLIERLQTAQVSEPQEADGLQRFGLPWQTDGKLTYSTLDESLATETLEVTEVNEGGSVPELKFVCHLFHLFRSNVIDLRGCQAVFYSRPLSFSFRLVISPSIPGIQGAVGGGNG